MELDGYISSKTSHSPEHIMKANLWMSTLLKGYDRFVICDYWYMINAFVLFFGKSGFLLLVLLLTLTIYLVTPTKV
jgi:hypothetical protein